MILSAKSLFFKTAMVNPFSLSKRALNNNESLKGLTSYKLGIDMQFLQGCLFGFVVFGVPGLVGVFA